MKIRTSAPPVHVWEKRRENKETVRIEVEIADEGIVRSPAFSIRVGWRPYRGRYFRYPGDGIMRNRYKEDERNAIVLAIVTPEEIREAVSGMVEKIAVLHVPEPQTPKELQE